jgi:plasmid stability protein
MPGLLIKNLPDRLHKKLREEAKKNHRSMAQEALTLLENGLTIPRKRKLPPLVRGKFLLTEEWINRAKREGRA